MELDREELLVAVRAASSVASVNHAVPIFNKVWLMQDHVLAFNNAGMVIHLSIDMPEIGGIDGRLLLQFLDRASEDTVYINATDGDKLKLNIGSSKATFAILEASDYVHELAKVPQPKATGVIELECDQLVEDMELDAMLNVMTLKHEQVLDFSSLVMDWRETKLTCYTSDRASINRTVIKMNEEIQLVSRMVPLELLRILKRNWELFMEGTFSVDNRYAIVSAEAATLYTQIAKPNKPVDFHEAITRLWPNQKVDTKLLVDIPEDLKEVLGRAALFANKDGHINLTVMDGELTVAASSETSGFTEVLPFEHPNQRVSVSVKLLLDTLPHADRMFVSERGVSMFGPKRFARFISSVSR